MKTLAATLVLVLVSFPLSVITASGEDAATEKLRIGVAPGYVPFSYIDQEDRLKGFDIDIALALCEKLDAACAFVRHDWEGLIPALRAGRFDAIVSSMSITGERRRRVAFTDRYYSNAVRFIARKGSDFDPSAPAGRTIGVARATVAADWLAANLSEVADIKLFTDQEAPLRALALGRVDALFGDGLGYWKWLQTPAGADFTFTGKEYHLDEGIGIAVRKEDEALRRRLNRALRAILDDGTYGKINARYFPFPIY